MFVLVTSLSGVNDGVAVATTDAPLLDKVQRWEPDVRLGRVQWQDFGYKRAVVTADGRRVYEIYETP